MRKFFFLITTFTLVLSCSSDETSTPVTPPAPIVKYTITLSAGEGGTVSTTGGEYEAGQTVSVTATPQGEYVFTSWSDGNTDATRTITVNSNSTLTANFEKKKYPLTVNIEGEGEVLEEIVNSGRTTDYDSGTTVKLTAIDSLNYEFGKWTGGIGLLHPYGKSIQLNNITSPKIVNAVFNDMTLFHNDSTGVYFSDYINEPDVMNVPDFRIIAPEGLPEHNLTIVDKVDGHPVRDGNKSIRINWAPGDCGQWPGGVGWKDCENDRGRSEIGDRNMLQYEEDTSIGWSYSMYLPKTSHINPHSNSQSVIFQIYHHTNNWLKPLMFLVANADGSIGVINHDEFNNDIIDRQTVIPSGEVYDKWHDIDVRIDFQDEDNATVTYTINGEIVYQIDRDMANQGDGRLDYEFRTGFYNGYFSRGPGGLSDWREQLMYVDNIVKKDHSFFE